MFDNFHREKESVRNKIMDNKMLVLYTCIVHPDNLTLLRKFMKYDKYAERRSGRRSADKKISGVSDETSRLL